MPEAVTADTDEVVRLLDAVNRNLIEKWYTGAQERLIERGAVLREARQVRRQRLQLRLYAGTMALCAALGALAVVTTSPALAVTAMLLGPMSLAVHAHAGRHARKFTRMSDDERDRLLVSDGVALVGGVGSLHAGVLEAQNTLGEHAREQLASRGLSEGTLEVARTLAKDGYLGSVDDLLEVARTLA